MPYLTKLCLITIFGNIVVKTKRIELWIEMNSFARRLCGFVEMGSLFSIAYIALIAIILKKMFASIRQNPGEKARAIKLLMPLFGFLVHSMTFDSIIFPHLNWLVHTLLVLLYNFTPEST